MEYRRFGRTEIQMPVLSCGGMRYQQHWGADGPIDDENQQNLEATIRRALELGIPHIETARGYGTSELQLGRLLPRLPREDFILQTKISPKHNPEEFRAEFEKAMSLLGVERLDLLGLHGINDEETLRMALECGSLEVAEQLRDEGRLRFIGFSTHGPTDIIRRAIATGRFDYVNLHYYWIFRDNEPAVRQAAEAQDMGVFIISPSDKGGMLYQPSDRLRELCKPLTPIQFNDLWTLARPGVHTLSVGAARPTDFDEHLAAVEQMAEAAPLLDEINERLRAAMAATLGADWCAHWHQGLPTWQDTPGHINVRVILMLWNLARAFDMVEYGKMRYNLLGKGGHWFPGHKADQLAAGEQDEAPLREALTEHPDPDRVLAALKEADQLLGGEEKKRLSEGG